MKMARLPGDFELAPGHTVASWRALNLDPNNPNTPDWDEALQIFSSRIRERFLNPIDSLIAIESGYKRSTFGFAILAIDFLVIETLQAFRDGTTNHNRQSERLFKDFLGLWNEFVICVPAGGTAGDMAKSIYVQGRCALHHTGSTDRLMVGIRGQMITFHPDGRIEVNRSLFHENLKFEFDRYLAQLKDPPQSEMRTRFKVKMDHISGL